MRDGKQLPPSRVIKDSRPTPDPLDFPRPLRFPQTLGYGKPERKSPLSFSLFGVLCFAAAMGSVLVVSRSSGSFVEPFWVIVYVGLCVSGAALAIVDIFRQEHPLFSWIVCIACLLFAAPAVLARILGLL